MQIDWQNILIAVSTLVIIALSLGIIITVTSTKFAIAEDNRITEVTAMLPGYNCGSCGHPGCAGFATALVSGTATEVSGCRPSKSEARERISNYLKEHVQNKE